MKRHDLFSAEGNTSGCSKPTLLERRVKRTLKLVMQTPNRLVALHRRVFNKAGKATNLLRREAYGPKTSAFAFSP